MHDQLFCDPSEKGITLSRLCTGAIIHFQQLNLCHSIRQTPTVQVSTITKCLNGIEKSLEVASSVRVDFGNMDTQSCYSTQGRRLNKTRVSRPTQY